MHLVAEAHDTAGGSPTPRELTARHRAPYGPLPTATQPSATGEDTLPSVFASENGPGAASTCQAVPSHRSVRTRTRPRLASPEVPTAMQLAALVQETPARLLPLAPTGT